MDPPKTAGGKKPHTHRHIHTQRTLTEPQFFNSEDPLVSKIRHSKKILRKPQQLWVKKCQIQGQYLNRVWVFTLPPVIIELENGSLQYIFRSFRVIFHFHDYGRKGIFLWGWGWGWGGYVKSTRYLTEDYIPIFHLGLITMCCCCLVFCAQIKQLYNPKKQLNLFPAQKSFQKNRPQDVGSVKIETFESSTRQRRVREATGPSPKAAKKMGRAWNHMSSLT